MIAGAAMGRGRGKEVIGVVRSADIIIILVDVFNQQHVGILLKELYDAGIRINCEKPDITVKRTAYGGIRLNAVGTLGLDIGEVRSILAESRMMNAEVLIRGNAAQEDLIDAVQGNRIYVPAFIAVNKVDLVDGVTYRQIEHELNARFGIKPLMISASSGHNMEELKDAIYDCLGFIRVYLKPQSGGADLEEPLIVRKGGTVQDVCTKLHRDFVHKFRYARIWGRSVKHPGQRVGLPHKLKDGDLLTIIIEH
jgi:ribosome-interacting GTPase 1